MTAYLMAVVSLANMARLFLLKIIVCLSVVIANHLEVKELRKLKIAHAKQRSRTATTRKKRAPNNGLLKHVSITKMVAKNGRVVLVYITKQKGAKHDNNL